MLTGPIEQVLEIALEVEMIELLGCEHHDPSGAQQRDTRNGTRGKTVRTEIGPVEIEVPRDRDGSFEPQPVRKQRRLTRRDEIVLSLTAQGPTAGEVAAHFADVYGRRCPRTRSR